jgi:hypothetical protein
VHGLPSPIARPKILVSRHFRHAPLGSLVPLLGKQHFASAMPVSAVTLRNPTLERNAVLIELGGIMTCGQIDGYENLLSELETIPDAPD